jgi:transposase
MKDINVLGIDLAKTIFQVHGSDPYGKELFRKRLTREGLKRFMINLKPCLIGMEACGGSHYWARLFQAMGHEVKLMSPQYVKPYVKTNKNDRNDAAACAEAVTRPSMRFVPIKSVKQQDLNLVHRVRSRLIKQRIQLTNQTRGLLAEYGIVIAQGEASFRKRLPIILSDMTHGLSLEAKSIFQELYSEYLKIAEQLNHYDRKIQQLSRQEPLCQRLETIPGIGPITSTALLAAVGKAEVFTQSRQLPAWLGLVPKQSSSGTQIRLLGISKRGDGYLRQLFIHGARSVVQRASEKQDRYHRWINQLVQRVGFNKAIVAVANKNARVVWALLRQENLFEADYQTVA